MAAILEFVYKKVAHIARVATQKIFTWHTDDMQIYLMLQSKREHKFTIENIFRYSLLVYINLL